MSEKKRDLVWLFLVFVVLIGVLPMLMWAVPGGYMHGMMGMMGLGWSFMLLIPIAFLVLIGLGVYYIMEPTKPGESSHRKGAPEILKERYARGEITREDYLKMKEDLES